MPIFYPENLRILGVGCRPDGEPVWYVALNVEAIPEEYAGQKVGVFALKREHKFSVRRDLAE